MKILFMLMLLFILIFISIYLNNINNITSDIYDLNIALIDSKHLDYYSSLCNINNYLGKKVDVVFINFYNIENMKNRIQFNNTYDNMFPKNNTNINNNNDIGGYISYNTLKHNKYSGISTESGFYYVENNNVTDISYGTSNITSFETKIINGKFNNYKIKIINYTSDIINDEDSNGYQDLLYFFTMIKNNYSNELFIIGGTIKLKYKLIELAFIKSSLNSISKLCPDKDITLNYFVIINNNLLTKYKSVKSEIISPYLYQSNDIFLVKIKGFKNKNIHDTIINNKLVWKEITGNFDNDYIIPDSFYNLQINKYSLENIIPSTYLIKSINSRLFKHGKQIKTIIDENNKKSNELKNDITTSKTHITKLMKAINNIETKYLPVLDNHYFATHK
ncbi:hypothetical protein [Alphaentomopoxvirus acuprea]|uniref:Uncharacterized protein n=1 Tax=Alphaentomopoxvirus acuprea TaxID=62099 RepID=W6JLK6_9POXV|nr:hypothetical protein BA82_gp156 [Anomala cuprea entomopoxvirus]BAO49516.1 hypothetical protein [Anomala cuprea entomopoxvirus]